MGCENTDSGILPGSGPIRFLSPAQYIYLQGS